MKTVSLITLSLLSTTALAGKHDRKHRHEQHIDMCSCADPKETEFLCDSIALGAKHEPNVGLPNQGIFLGHEIYYDVDSVTKTYTASGRKVCQMDVKPADEEEYLTITMKELFVANMYGEECEGLRCYRGKKVDTRA